MERAVPTLRPQPLGVARWRRWGTTRVAVTVGITLALLATGIGTSDVLAQERRNRQRVRPSATTLSVGQTLAVATAVGFDGAGTQHQSTRSDGDFTVFDEVAKFDDTDDRPRGAEAKTKQLSTVVDDGTSIHVRSRSDGEARYYDRDTGDGFQPAAGGESLLSVTFDVVGGTAFFSLRGSIHGEGSGSGSTGCGRVSVTGPDGTLTELNCGASHTLPIDQSGPLGPGTYNLSLDGDTDTELGHARAGAAFSWDIALIVSGCTIEGTPGDDPDLGGTAGDDVICGFGGADTIDGGDGDDTIFGGAGDDQIDGGRGADTILGNDGEDAIRGGGGRDIVFGGADSDNIDDALGPNPMLDGGDGIDSICGSPQRDTIRGGPGGDILRGLGGPDTISGDAGRDLIFGEGGPNATAVCGPAAGSGASQRDDLDGGAGDDELHGGPDRDRINGGSGKDELFGEAANDTLNACDGIRDRKVSGGTGGNDVVRRDNVDPSSGIEVRRPC